MASMRFLSIAPGHVEMLSLPGCDHKAAHVFGKRQIDAINAALGAGRPLLVRGEPGIGKSQLARAAAKALGWAYLPFVADVRTESRDLMCSFDAVARLADAQARPEHCGSGGGQALPIQNYLTPGVLWWAFSWKEAEAQSKVSCVPEPYQADGGDPKAGCVVLIDEIDKADADVPNGLLEALGIGQFSVRGRSEPVRISDTPLLVIITTNEERTLPDAFLRRCLVLHLHLSTDAKEAEAHFVRVGKAHFGDMPEEVIQQAAELVARERQNAARRHWRPLPGQAEFVDLLRSVSAQAGNDSDKQKKLLATVSQYVLAKDPAAAKSWLETSTGMESQK